MNEQPIKLARHEHEIACDALSYRSPGYAGEVAYVNCFEPPRPVVEPDLDRVPTKRDNSTYPIKFVAIWNSDGILVWLPIERQALP